LNQARPWALAPTHTADPQASTSNPLILANNIDIHLFSVRHARKLIEIFGIFPDQIWSPLVRVVVPHEAKEQTLYVSFRYAHRRSRYGVLESERFAVGSRFAI
jgi:hypothetical protein